MNKGKSIFILVLVWAGLLVAVLYSPIGSPELYAPMNYSIIHGVKFENSGIKNSTDFKSHFYENDDPYVSALSYEYEFNTSAYDAEGSNISKANRGVGPVTYNNSSYRSNANDLTNGVGETYVMSAVRRNSSRSASPLKETGITSMSVDITGLEDNMIPGRQSVDYIEGSGATDLGGDGTTPIPVGDGLPFLIILVVAYATWKKMSL